MRKREIFFFCGLTIVLVNFFQNCSLSLNSGFQDLGKSTYESSLNAASSIPDTSHPSKQALTVVTKSAHISNKLYVATLLRENFTSTNYPVPGLDAIIEKWIIRRGAQFGLGCDPYGTYSGRDCNSAGSGTDISGANLDYYMDDNTVRETFRLQFCDRVLGMDQGVEALLEKVEGVQINAGTLASTTPPNESRISSLYSLFYRADDASADVMATLMQLDHSLAENKENSFERWRGLAVAICQSSGWQVY